MKTVAQIIFAYAPAIIAGIIPFRRIVRGGSVKWAFFLCWGLLIVTFALWSLGIPLICAAFSRNLAREVWSWVPEGPAVFALVIFGWVYAGITVVLAQLTCCFLQKQYPDDEN